MNTQISVLISVVVPTCHRNDLLAKCLDCLAPRNQVLSPDQYEVIVTDDGSKSTAELMIAEQYSWVRWTQGPRRGPAANRNHGASLALGSWIAFTDDDCLPDRLWLSAFRESIAEDIHVYEGKTVCRDWPNSPLFEAPINETGGYLWSCNFLISRCLFLEMGGFDEHFPYAAMEDVDLRERIRDLSKSICFVPTAIVDHPARPRRSCKSRMFSRESEAFYFRKRHDRVRVWTDITRPILHEWLRGLVKGPNRLHFLRLTPLVLAEVFLILVMQRSWRAKHESILR